MVTHQRGGTGFAVVLLLIGGLGLLLAWRFPLHSRFFPSWWSALLNLAMMALGLWVLCSGVETTFQIYPLIISCGLLAMFGGSLWTNKSMVERFAELYEKNITPKKKAYMRQITQLWCMFFFINLGISTYTWQAMSLSAWTWYNGVISYILMGLLFVGEYSYRRLIFLRNL